MSQIKTLFALFICCATVAIAQNTNSELPESPAVQVSPAALTGMVEHKSLPQYPKEAMLKGVQGDVVFKVVVDENGKIVRSETVAGDPLLVAASKDALPDYRFHPYLQNGTPVAFNSELGYHFTLSQKGGGATGNVECMTTIP